MTCARCLRYPPVTTSGLGLPVALGERGACFDKNTRGQIQNAGCREGQRHVFERQLVLAASLGAPLVAHTMPALEDTLELMTRRLSASHSVHVHGIIYFSGMAARLVAPSHRLYLCFTGVCTFHKGRDVQQVVRETPWWAVHGTRAAPGAGGAPQTCAVLLKGSRRSRTCPATGRRRAPGPCNRQVHLYVHRHQL